MTLREWLKGQMAQLQDALDTLDKVSAVEAQLDEMEATNADLLAAQEEAARRIKHLEDQIVKLEAEKPGPDPAPKPLKPEHKVTVAIRNDLDQVRLNEYVSSSIPLPQEWGVKSVENLAVGHGPSESNMELEDFLLLPADIRPIAWWPDKAIQCVVVEFRMPVIPAKYETAFELLVGVPPGTNPLPSSKLVASEAWKGEALRVNTGASTFTVDALGFYDDPSLGDAVLMSGSLHSEAGCYSTFEGKSSSQAPKAGLIKLEYAGPLVAIVYVEAFTGQAFGPPPHNKVIVCRRYIFRAESSLVQCREWIKWEGTWNGGAPRYMKDSGRKDGEGKPIFTNEPNVILGTLWRERFTLSSPVASLAVLDMAGEVARLGANSLPLTLAYDLRPQRLKAEKGGFVAYPRQPRLEAATGTTANGQEGGMVSCSTDRGMLTVAIKDMHRMEPCAIGVSGNTINLDLASVSFYLAHHQGMWQEYGIDVRGADQPAPDLRAIWAQINHPLRGLCAVEHYNAAEVQSPLPSLSQPDVFPMEKTPDSMLGRYFRSLTEICDNTLTKIEEEGLWGLMIRGLFPRDWGRWGRGTGELGYNPNPTPGYPKGFPVGVSGWAEAYLHGYWADYWNVCRLAWDGAVRLGRPELINSLLMPAALRMLHTQIVQGAPEDPWTYIGGAPYGYGMYRSDNNSSHQYFETLFQYYYLTGDPTVPQTIERAAKYETTRLLTESKLGLSGRQPGQWIAAARFLAATSTSGFDWNERFLTLMRTAIERHYLPINADLAVWTERPLKPGEANRTQQLFTWGHYDAELLWWFMQATGDAPVEYDPDNDVRPSEILIKTARAVCTLGMTLKGNMKSNAAGPWVRLFDIAADGKTLSPGTETIDYLWEDDIPAMAAWISRAALLSNDAHLKKVSRALVEYSLSQSLGKGWPMNKITGLQQARLGAAVAAELEIEARERRGA